MTSSIAEALNTIAEIANVPLGGLDQDLLDIVALRLIVECDDERAVSALKRIVNEVRHAQRAIDEGPGNGRSMGSDVVLLDEATDRSADNRVSP